jgi:hypothetical protein
MKVKKIEKNYCPKRFPAGFDEIAMSTGSSTPPAPFARSALSAASARESLPVWLHDSRGVAEIAEENNPNGGRFSLKTAKKPANRLKCLSMNNLHAKPWLFPSAPIKANQGKSGHKYRIPSLKSASAAENVAQPSSAAGSSAARRGPLPNWRRYAVRTRRRGRLRHTFSLARPIRNPNLSTRFS